MYKYPDTAVFSDHSSVPDGMNGGGESPSLTGSCRTECQIPIRLIPLRCINRESAFFKPGQRTGIYADHSAVIPVRNGLGVPNLRKRKPSTAFNRSNPL